MKMRMDARLQLARLAAGLSQSQLAKASGVPVGTIRDYEQNGSIGGARASTAKILADVLGVTIEELLEPMPTSRYGVTP